MNLLKKVISFGTSAALLASLLATAVAPSAFAAASVTVITGSPVSISADTTGAAGGTGVYTALTGPSLVLGAVGDITTGNLVFAAPAGFQFNPAGSPAFTGPAGFAATASVTASTITYFVSASNTATGTVTFSGWTVRPVAGAPLASGNITLSASSTSAVNGVAAGTSVGTLTEPFGAATHYALSAASTTPTVSTTDLITARQADQFGNTVTSATTTITWILGGFGSLSGSAATLTAGVGTSTLTAGAVAGQTSTITVVDGSARTGSVTVTATAAVVVGPPPPSSLHNYTFTVTGAGSVPVTGETGAVSIAVGEGFADGWSTSAGGGNTLTFTLLNACETWTGTPAISGAPTSLGTFTISGVGSSVLTVNFTNSNQAQVENFTIGGMTITTDTCPVGPVRVSVAQTVGSNGNGTIPFGAGTASGTITGDLAAGNTAVPYVLDTGSFSFAPTDANNGNLLIAAPDAEARGIATVPSSTLLNLATVTGAFHADGTVITQSVSIQGLLVMGNIVPTINETANGPALVQPGENNQILGVGNSVVAAETNAATLAKSSVVTFKLDAAGVTFSTAPTATPSGASLALNSPATAGTAVLCPLSFDRTSCSVTVTAKSTAAGAITLSNISLDLAATVAAGTKINIVITTSPAVPVNVISQKIATVSRIVVGVAAQPTIFINENDQATGMITLTESAAGLLTAAAGNNYIGLCIPASSGESFTRAPWAVVTVGDLKLRSGVVGAASVQGTQFSAGGLSCVEWIVYSKSTTASTIEIRGSDASNVVLASGANNGPRLSVPNTAAPGANAIRVLNGSQADVEANAPAALVTTVSNAIRAFRNQPVVVALTQPFIAPGTPRALLGNITITETAAGQFKAGERICVAVVALNTNEGYAYQTHFVATNFTADMPVIATNSASGLLTGAASVSQNFFCFTVLQQATGTLGVLTISNMVVFTPTDAHTGPILVDVSGGFLDTTTGTFVATGRAFEQVVTAGNIGTAPATSGKTGIAFITQTRLGATKLGTFTATTKVAALNKYQTWRFAGGSRLAGKIVTIWKATKNSAGIWSAFTKLTTRLADSSGNAFFWYRSSSKVWISVRASYAGDATHFLSWSVARQARWM